MYIMDNCSVELDNDTTNNTKQLENLYCLTN